MYLVRARRSRRIILLSRVPHPLFLLLPALVHVLTGCADDRAGSQEADSLYPQHIILVSIDTLRADRLGLYGHDRETDTHLVQLARDSVVFDHCYSQSSQTLVSHKSLLRGKYPLRLIQESTNARMSDFSTLEDPAHFIVDAMTNLSTPSLTNVLKKRGYFTAGMVDNGWMREKFGFAKWFDSYEDEAGGFAQSLPLVKKFLKKRHKRPFFLFLHSYDVHCPYHKPEPYNSFYCQRHDDHVNLESKCKFDLYDETFTPRDYEAIQGHYDSGINYADVTGIAELLDQLKQHGLYEECLLIITSDHGESLGENRVVGHGGLRPEQLHVPLVIKFPQSLGIKPGRVDTLTELVDVMPTIFAVCGIPQPDGLDGKSITTSILEGKPHRKYIVAQTTIREHPEFTTNLAKRSILEPGKWHVIHDALNNKINVYDLQSDPDALTDIGQNKPEVVPRLLALLTQHDPLEGGGEFVQPDQTHFDEELRKQLKSL